MAKIEMSDNAFGCAIALLLVVLALAFAGEPDLMDAIVARIMEDG